MAFLRFAVATEDFDGNLKSSIRKAAGLPVTGLRLNARTEVRAAEFGETAVRQLRHYIEEHQMRVAGLYYSSRHSLADPDRLEQRLDGIRTAMKLVRKLGTEPLLIRCGRIPDPTPQVDSASSTATSSPDDIVNPFSFASPKPAAHTASPAEEFKTLCEILNELAALASHVGCRLQLIVAEFRVARIQQLVRAVSPHEIQIAFDPATCLMTGADPVSVFRNLYQHIGYIRARDALKDVDGAGIEVAPGHGTVDWEELIPTFAEADFSSWVCVERTGGDQRAEEVSDGVTRLRRLAPVPPTGESR
ncbi:MAG: sugar phosphate isomerase/epimerase [Planctomycetaceae bacterium]|nr:sugar phosphate isomerase/epimerase [Planctomycetaceae bacterium]